MPKLNRSSFIDAQKAIENLLPDEKIRKKVIGFYADAISYANQLNAENWSLNLDLNGKFLRFNVGHEFCLTLYKSHIHILCDRACLKKILKLHNIPLEYQGYYKSTDKKITNIDEAPRILMKTKDNVGCYLYHQYIVEYIDILTEANRRFIDGAVLTRIQQNMIDSNSPGAIEYIYSEVDSDLGQPNKQEYWDFIQEEDEEIARALVRTEEERQRRMNEITNKKPTSKIVIQRVFHRNPDVVASALYRAKGKCERCQNNAPFLTAKRNTPYLEVHHIIPLAEGGDDSLENAIALCPNCHRHLHYGKLKDIE